MITAIACVLVLLHVLCISFLLAKAVTATRPFPLLLFASINFGMALGWILEVILP